MISPRGILKTTKNWNDDFSGQDMRSFFYTDGNPNFGNCILTCHHRLRTTQNIAVEDIAIAGNSFTHPLVAPNLPMNHQDANSYNSKEYALKHGAIFDKTCQVAAVQATVDYQ